MLFVLLLRKKIDKQLVKSYCPVSSLHICGKRFKILLYNSLFHLLIQLTLVLNHVTLVLTNQMLSITHEIYHSMDEGYEIGGLLLDISKAGYGQKALLLN